jgi:large subunit ribosomal protein L4
MAAKALAVVLSGKLSEGRVMLVDSMDLKEPKTKDARALLTGLGTAKGYGEVATRRKHAALIVVEKKSPAMKKSFSNMGNVLVEEVRNINPVEILKYRYLVLVSPDEVVGTLTTRVQK